MAILGTGRIELLDLSDALVAGSQPAVTKPGQLWLDTSATPPILKRYDNGLWQELKLDVMKLDEGLKKTVENVLQTLGSIATDNSLNYSDRLILLNDLNRLIGKIVSTAETNSYPTELPSVADLDRDGLGTLAVTRKSATSVGIKENDRVYTQVAEKYEALRTYLAGIPGAFRAWDITKARAKDNLDINGDDFRAKWLDFYNALLQLEGAILATPGPAGQAADNLVLTNEVITIATDDRGENGIYSGATTKVFVYEGSKDSTSSWRVLVQPSEGIEGTFVNDTYTVTKATQDHGYLNFTATKEGHATLTKRVAVSKLKTGAAAVLDWMDISTYVINKSIIGQYNPDKVLLSAKTRIGGADALPLKAKFRITEVSTDQAKTVVYTSAQLESSYTYTVTNADLTRLEVELLNAEGLVIDKQTILVVSDGVSADPTLVLSLDNDSYQIPCDDKGFPLRGALDDAVVTLSGFLGTLPANLTKSPYTVTFTPSTGVEGNQGTNAAGNRLTYRITSMSTDTGKVDIAVEHPKHGRHVKTFRLAKTKNGKPGEDAIIHNLEVPTVLIQKGNVWQPATVTPVLTKRVGSASAQPVTGWTYTVTPVYGTESGEAQTITGGTAFTVANLAVSGKTLTSVVVRATKDGVVEEEVIEVLRDGVKGEDGISALNVVIDNDTLVVHLDGSGEPKADTFTTEATFCSIRVFDGQKDVTSSYRGELVQPTGYTVTPTNYSDHSVIQYNLVARQANAPAVSSFRVNLTGEGVYGTRPLVAHLRVLTVRDGANGERYYMTSSASSLKRSLTGALTPATLTLTSYYLLTGDTTPVVSTHGKIKVSYVNQNTPTVVKEYPAGNQVISLTEAPTDLLYVKAEYLSKDNHPYDIESIPVLRDGTDSYSLDLTTNNGIIFSFDAKNVVTGIQSTTVTATTVNIESPTYRWSKNGEDVLTGTNSSFLKIEAEEMKLKDSIVILCRVTGKSGDRNVDITDSITLTKIKSGSSTYMWRAFADDENGTNISKEPGTKKYVGYAYNQDSPNQVLDPTLYVWTPTKYFGDDLQELAKGPVNGQNEFSVIDLYDLSPTDRFYYLNLDVAKGTSYSWSSNLPATTYRLEDSTANVTDLPVTFKPKGATVRLRLSEDAYWKLRQREYYFKLERGEAPTPDNLVSVKDIAWRIQNDRAKDNLIYVNNLKDTSAFYPVLTSLDKKRFTFETDRLPEISDKPVLKITNSVTHVKLFATNQFNVDPTQALMISVDARFTGTGKLKVLVAPDTADAVDFYAKHSGTIDENDYLFVGVSDLGVTEQLLPAATLERSFKTHKFFIRPNELPTGTKSVHIFFDLIEADLNSTLYLNNIQAKQSEHYIQYTPSFLDLASRNFTINLTNPSTTFSVNSENEPYPELSSQANSTGVQIQSEGFAIEGYKLVITRTKGCTAEVIDKKVFITDVTELYGFVEFAIVYYNVVIGVKKFLFSKYNKDRTTYTWSAYASSYIAGKVTGFSFVREGRNWLGTAINMPTPDRSEDPDYYTWTRLEDEKYYSDTSMDDRDYGEDPIMVFSDRTQEGAIAQVEIEGMTVIQHSPGYNLLKDGGFINQPQVGPDIDPTRWHYLNNDTRFTTPGTNLVVNSRFTYRENFERNANNWWKTDDKIGWGSADLGGLTAKIDETHPELGRDKVHIVGFSTANYPSLLQVIPLERPIPIGSKVTVSLKVATPDGRGVKLNVNCHFYNSKEPDKLSQDYVTRDFWDSNKVNNWTRVYKLMTVPPIANSTATEVDCIRLLIIKNKEVPECNFYVTDVFVGIGASDGTYTPSLLESGYKWPNPYGSYDLTGSPKEVFNSKIRVSSEGNIYAVGGKNFSTSTKKIFNVIRQVVEAGVTPTNVYRLLLRTLDLPNNFADNRVMVYIEEMDSAKNIIHAHRITYKMLKDNSMADYLSYVFTTTNDTSYLAVALVADEDLETPLYYTFCRLSEDSLIQRTGNNYEANKITSFNYSPVPTERYLNGELQAINLISSRYQENFYYPGSYPYKNFDGKTYGKSRIRYLNQALNEQFRLEEDYTSGATVTAPLALKDWNNLDIDDSTYPDIVERMRTSKVDSHTTFNVGLAGSIEYYPALVSSPSDIRYLFDRGTNKWLDDYHFQATDMKLGSQFLEAMDPSNPYFVKRDRIYSDLRLANYYGYAYVLAKDYYSTGKILAISSSISFKAEEITYSMRDYANLRLVKKSRGPAESRIKGTVKLVLPPALKLDSYAVLEMVVRHEEGNDIDYKVTYAHHLEPENRARYTPKRVLNDRSYLLSYQFKVTESRNIFVELDVDKHKTTEIEFYFRGILSPDLIIQDLDISTDYKLATNRGISYSKKNKTPEELKQDLSLLTWESLETSYSRVKSNKVVVNPRYPEETAIYSPSYLEYKEKKAEYSNIMNDVSVRLEEPLSRISKDVKDSIYFDDKQMKWYLRKEVLRYEVRPETIAVSDYYFYGNLACIELSFTDLQGGTIATEDPFKTTLFRYIKDNFPDRNYKDLVRSYGSTYRIFTRTKVANNTRSLKYYLTLPTELFMDLPRTVNSKDHHRRYDNLLQRVQYKFAEWVTRTNAAGNPFYIYFPLAHSQVSQLPSRLVRDLNKLTTYEGRTFISFGGFWRPKLKVKFRSKAYSNQLRSINDIDSAVDTSEQLKRELLKTLEDNRVTSDELGKIGALIPVLESQYGDIKGRYDSILTSTFISQANRDNLRVRFNELQLSYNNLKGVLRDGLEHPEHLTRETAPKGNDDSTFYKDRFLDKFANYKTNLEFLSGLIQSLYGSGLQDFIDKVNSSEFVKKTEMSTFSDRFNFMVRGSGGSNLILNSTGWMWDYDPGDAPTPDEWRRWKLGPDTQERFIQSIQGDEYEAIGCASGFDFSDFSGKKLIYQHVVVRPGTYAMSCYLRTNYEGRSISVTIYEGSAIKGDNYIWRDSRTSKSSSLTITDPAINRSFRVESNLITVVIECDANNTGQVAALMLKVGDTPSQWVPHATESYNSNVRIDSNGLKVYQNGSKAEREFTRINSREFSGYYRGEKIFTLNKNTTIVQHLEVRKNIYIGPVTIQNEGRSGISFVQSEIRVHD